MTDSQTPTYRSYTTPTGDRIEYRAPDDEDGVFEVRMPIATTGEVRNEGDDPLTRDELDGMARQINDGGLGVFLDHGSSPLGGPARYSAVGKLGEWTDASVDGERDDGEDALMATARLMDPETLPNGVSDLRAAVGAIQEQVTRGFSVAASIGWREDEDYPGGNDLMEASIVGIGADPRTTSDSDAGLVARAAVEAGADPDALLASVRDAVEGGVGEREVTPQQAEQAIDLIDQFVDAQGDATVRNFESWLWEIDDEEADDNAIHAARTALQEFYRDNSPMDDPVEESFRDWITSKMSDGDDTPDDDGGTTDDEQDAEQTERDETPEWVSELRELLESIHDAVREDDDMDDDDDDEEQEADEDGDEDEDMDDQSTTEQDVDDEVAERIADLEAELEKVRSGEVDVESPGGDDADGDGEQRDTDDSDDPFMKEVLSK